MCWSTVNETHIPETPCMFSGNQLTEDKLRTAISRGVEQCAGGTRQSLRLSPEGPYNRVMSSFAHVDKQMPTKITANHSCGKNTSPSGMHRITPFLLPKIVLARVVQPNIFALEGGRRLTELNYNIASVETQKRRRAVWTKLLHNATCTGHR